MRRWRGPLQECERCHRLRPKYCKEKCVTCYHNARRPYQPTGAGMGGPGIRRGPADVAGRLEDYAEIRSRHYTISQAAERLGISRRTADRYEARLRAQKGAA